MAEGTASRLMRIVAHNGARIWGGAERASVSLLRGLADRGHQVHLLCNDDKVAEEADARGISTEICEIGGDIALHHAPHLARVLRRHRPDAFIITTYKKLFLASLGARMAKVPRIVARVGLESDTPRSIKYRIALRRWTDGVVVNASRMIEPFTRLEGFDRAKVRLIWNGVRTERKARDPMRIRLELGISADELLVGTVARLAKQKRIDRLIEAVAMVPGVECVVAGDGTRREELENHARHCRVDRRFRFLGHRDDVSDLLEALDIFIVASDSEGLSNAMLEAMAHGLPVISTNVSGAEDALAANEGGVAPGIITGFDAAGIAEAIRSLQDAPEMRHAMGAAARSRAVSQFSREKMLDAWEDFLSPREGA